MKTSKSSSIFENIFSKSMILSCMCTSGVFHSGLQQMTLLKYYNCIKPSEEERIQSVCLNQSGPLARLIPCSTIESANNAVHKSFTDAGEMSMKTVQLPNVYLVIAISIAVLLLYANYVDNIVFPQGRRSSSYNPTPNTSKGHNFTDCSINLSATTSYISDLDLLL